VLVLARTRDRATGRSVLAGRRTTCLPKYMERTAYLATSWRLGRYYRTYPAYVEDEVRAALANPDVQFERGPVTLSARGTAPSATCSSPVPPTSGTAEVIVDSWTPSGGCFYPRR
jgi:hypothetical protein